MTTDSKKAVQSMQDGLENIVTGMGTGQDKSTSNYWINSGKNHDHPQLTARFREDWIAQKVCTIIPQDMTRTWRKFKGDNQEDWREADEFFGVAKLFRDSYKWARVYGTSCILLDVKGAGKMDTPLDLDRLKKGCVKSLQVVDRTRLFGIGEINTDPLSPEYGYPTYYQLGGDSNRIHHTRIIRFEGTELPRYENWHNKWYSDSILIPLTTVIDNFHTAANAAAALTHEASTDVVSIEGLQGLLTNPAGEAAILKRFRLMKQMKSIYNITLLDSTEEYSTKTVALNGVKDLIWEYLRIIAAAVGIPATRFLSASPDGMNATGESDLNSYIDVITGLQKSIFVPRITKLDKVIGAHFGLAEPLYEWNCVFPESALQHAEKLSKLIAPLVELVEAGIFSAQQAHDVIVEKRLYEGVKTLGTAPTESPALAIAKQTKETTNAPTNANKK